MKKPFDIDQASQMLAIENYASALHMGMGLLEQSNEAYAEKVNTLLESMSALQNKFNTQLQQGSVVLGLSSMDVQSVVDAGIQTSDLAIEALKEKLLELKEQVKTSYLPDKDKKRLSKNISGVVSNVDKMKDTPKPNKVDAKNISKDDEKNKKLEKQKKLLIDIASTARVVGNAFGESSEEITAIIGVIGLVATGTENVIQSLSKSMVQGIQAGTEVVVTSMSSVEKASVILAVITATIQVAMAIVNIFSASAKKQEEERKQQEKINRGMLKAEIEYQILLSKRLYTEQKITSEKIKQAKVNVGKASASTDKVYNIAMKEYRQLMEKARMGDYSIEAQRDLRKRAQGFLDIANALKNGDKDKLDSLFFSQDNDKDKWGDYKQMASNALTSQQEWRNTLKEIADEITGSASDYMGEFIEALQLGEEATYNFAENFKKRMRDAIISGLAENLIYAKIDKLLAKVQDDIMGENGVGIDGITKAMMDAWVAEAEKIQEDAIGVSKTINGILDGLGLDNATQDNKLSNAISGVTEETAAVLSGQLNAIRSGQGRHIDISNQQLNILKEMAEVNMGHQLMEQSVTALTQIAANTKNLDRLKAIERSLEQINSGVNGTMSNANSLKSQGLEF